MKEKTKRIAVAEVLLPLLAVLVGVVLLKISTPVLLQAAAPVPRNYSFVGEYSWDREHWYPLEEAGELSAFDGDLYLRGHLDDTIWEECVLHFFSNHISSEIYVNGQLHQMDILMELERYGVGIQPAMCGRGWNAWYFEKGLPQDAFVEIHLKNPHSFGNKSAYMDFLETMYSTNGEVELLKNALAIHSSPQTGVGIVLGIVATMLLGAAIAGVLMRMPISWPLAKLGLLAGFAGGYFILDTIGLSFWSENNLLNTFGLQVCMMYAVYFVGLTALDVLAGKSRRVAGIAMGFSAALNGLLVLLSFGGAVMIYDTQIYWVISQLILCPLLTVCCLSSLSRRPVVHKITVLFFCATFLSILLDIAGVMYSRYSQGTVTKLAFLVFFCYVFVMSIRNVIQNQTASVRAKTLEKELEENRIALMLSQIQPHFMFNVLGTLRGLCREDPEQAWRGLGDFSTYLRGNMNALSNSRAIRFETELRHVETYLRLEKMRLGSKLNIVYDIQEKDFDIPPLTLQPLVENAVKHGIFYKTGGGTVIIRSRRENGKIIMSVQDDGVGFSAKKPENALEQHNHVGLNNVRSRVEIMLGGRLLVESGPEQGSVVTIEIPVSEKGA